MESVDDAINAITEGNGVERICEASGSSAMLGKAFKWLRKGGKIGIVGIPKGTVQIENPLPGKYTFIVLIYEN